MDAEELVRHLRELFIEHKKAVDVFVLPPKKMCTRVTVRNWTGTDNVLILFRINCNRGIGHWLALLLNANSIPSVVFIDSFGHHPSFYNIIIELNFTCLPNQQIQSTSMETCALHILFLISKILCHSQPLNLFYLQKIAILYKYCGCYDRRTCECSFDDVVVRNDFRVAKWYANRYGKGSIK
jgi:hypothetical protein